MKKYMPLNGLRWSRDSGSTLCDTPQNGRSRTGWGVETVTLEEIDKWNDDHYEGDDYIYFHEYELVA